MKKTNSDSPIDSKELAISAIKKKLVGKPLSYKEIYAIMDQISSERLGPVLTTYFAAASFREGFNSDELYYLTRAMVETGPHLTFSGLVAGKHSLGGVAGSRTTMIVVPIVAAAGFKIPKNSTRAITSPAGTADTMEVLAPVTFTSEQIEGLVEKANGCIVWGGHLGLAPADDVIIQIEQPLAFESFDKVIVSIMAKQIASGVNHLVLDIPYGPTMKVEHLKEAQVIARKFSYLAEKFKIDLYPYVNEMTQNAGRGVGPLLEARDVLKVLEQKSDRPLPLEEKSIKLSGYLLDLCLADSPDRIHESGEKLARDLLISGKALEAMRNIIKAQGGNDEITSDKLEAGNEKFEYKSTIKGIITRIHNQQIAAICRILGCPMDKKSGIYLDRKLGEPVDRNDILCTLYTSDKWKLQEAVETLKSVPIYSIK
jgi:putative thymidine phosphorylase